MQRVCCYIDGFNLYHAIHDLNRPWLKWVNLHSLASSLLREQEVLEAVNYFSAYATWLPGAYARHRAFVKALEASRVVVTMAHFKKKKRSCKKCHAEWKENEEKETDVRLALKILEDASDNKFDRAIIISADSDLVPVVETVRRKFAHKTILIATPPGRHGSARDLCSKAHSSTQITPGRIERCLFDKVIKDANGNMLVARPTNYDR